MTTTATTIARGFVIRTNFVGPTTHRGSRISARYAPGYGDHLSP